MRIRAKILLLSVAFLFWAGATVYEYRTPIRKFCKRQVIEFKLQVFKSYLINLQNKYGIDGALDA